MPTNQRLVERMERKSGENFLAATTLSDNHPGRCCNAVASRAYYSAYQAVVKELEANHPELNEANATQFQDHKDYPHGFVRNQLSRAGLSTSYDRGFYKRLQSMREKGDYGELCVEPEEITSEFFEDLAGLLSNLGVELNAAG